MFRRILLAALAVGSAAGAVGCKHCCRRHHRDPGPAAGTLPGGYLGDPGRPGAGNVYIPPPPGGLPSGGAPDVSAPISPPGGDPGPSLPPPTIPEGSRSFRPDPARPNGPQLLLPDPLPGASSSGGRFLGEPARTDGGDLPPRPATRDERSGQVPGVGGFTVVKPGLAAGRKPGLEGFDALKARGYRTAVYLHGPADDAAAAKELAERKGLAFVGIPVTPATLGAAFDRFKEAAGDAANRPAFVFADDGLRAGSLWYLYFRVVDQLGDDAARIRATPLGLTTDGDEATKYWLAVQDYLAKR